MLTPTTFRDLLSGRRNGLGPTVVRGGLRVAEAVYTAAVRWRNHRYDCGTAAVQQVAVPVVSVGNLTLGGTGKTPMVEWLARWFRAHDMRPAVLSRGYGAAAGARNDEALELARELPDIPHLQNPDRVAAAHDAITQFGAQVIVLDDGFQHRRLARNVDIVLLDAFEPFGFNHVFPRGTLREPLAGLQRANVVVLTRADILDAPRRAKIWERVHCYAPQAVCVEATHAPWGLLAANGGQESLASLRGAPVAAFCGVGNPAGFRHTLHTCGCRVRAFREFPDHHRYSRSDIEALSAWVRPLDVSAVLCTQKDLVKIPVEEVGGRRLWALAVKMELLSGQNLLEDRLPRL